MTLSSAGGSVPRGPRACVSLGVALFARLASRLCPYMVVGFGAVPVAWRGPSANSRACPYMVVGFGPLDVATLWRWWCGARARASLGIPLFAPWS